MKDQYSNIFNTVIRNTSTVCVEIPTKSIIKRWNYSSGAPERVTGFFFLFYWKEWPWFNGPRYPRKIWKHLSQLTDSIEMKKLIWWRHQMETFSALLAICAGNSPVSGYFPAQRPVPRSFDVFFDLHLNKRLSKQSWGGDLRRHRARYDVTVIVISRTL